MKLFEIIEEKRNVRFSLETSSDYPDVVFMHGSSFGFTSCRSFTKQQAKELAAALVDFAAEKEAEEVTA